MNYTTFKTIVNTIEHLDVQHHNAKQIYGQVLHTEVLEALAPTTATDKLYGLLYSEMKTHAKTALDAFKHSGFGRIISDKKSPYYSVENLYRYCFPGKPIPTEQTHPGITVTN